MRMESRLTCLSQQLRKVLPENGSPGSLQGMALFGMNPFERPESQHNDRERILPFCEKKTYKNMTLRASLQWCGSQTPKDTAPVPGYKRTKWLPGGFRGGSAGKKYSWRPACIHYLPCGKQHQSFWENRSLSSNPCGGINRRLMQFPLK